MKNVNTKNYGFSAELQKQHQKDTDWVFGATSAPCIAQIPQEERERYLPMGEVQRGTEDMMDCASRGAINILEAKFTWLIVNKKPSADNLNWLKNNGYVQNEDRVEFSDCFLAQNSSTTRQGNSLIAPLEAIRKQGLIPKHILPLQPWMTWNDYHDPKRITQEMRDLGMEFTRRFLINYERVLEKDAETLLKQDFQYVAGYAWPEPINGEYPRIDLSPNHVFVAFKSPKYFIFDNYINPISRDFVKKLASDYNIYEYGYRLFITEIKVAPPPILITKSLWQTIQAKFSPLLLPRSCSSFF